MFLYFQFSSEQVLTLDALTPESALQISTAATVEGSHDPVQESSDKVEGPRAKGKGKGKGKGRGKGRRPKVNRTDKSNSLGSLPSADLVPAGSPPQLDQADGAEVEERPQQSTQQDESFSVASGAESPRSDEASLHGSPSTSKDLPRTHTEVAPEASPAAVSPSSPQLEEVEVARAPSTSLVSPPSLPMALTTAEVAIQQMPQPLAVKVSQNSSSSSISSNSPKTPSPTKRKRSEVELLLSDSRPQKSPRVSPLERSRRHRATPDRFQAGTDAGSSQGSDPNMVQALNTLHNKVSNLETKQGFFSKKQKKNTQKINSAMRRLDKMEREVQSVKGRVSTMEGKSK